MTTPKRGRGRPKKLASVITISVDRLDVEAAEELVPVFDRVNTLGVRHNRTDVIRACIKRGLASLRQELQLTVAADDALPVESMVRSAGSRALKRAGLE